MAVRAGAEVTEVDASHAVGGSQPSAVAAVIACRQGRTVTTQTDPVASAEACRRQLRPIRQDHRAASTSATSTSVHPGALLLCCCMMALRHPRLRGGHQAPRRSRLPGVGPRICERPTAPPCSSPTTRSAAANRRCSRAMRIVFMDVLGIDQAIVAGFDGDRTVNVLAALWPERCRAMVSVSGYLIGSQAANVAPLEPGGRAGLVVPVLLRHGAGPEVTRPTGESLPTSSGAPCHRSGTSATRPSNGCCRPRQRRPRRDRRQLPVAHRPVPGEDRYMDLERVAQLPVHRRADDHPRRRRQRRPPPRTAAYVFGGSPASTSTGPSPRDRPQPPTGRSSSLRRRNPRSRHVHLTPTEIVMSTT